MRNILELICRQFPTVVWIALIVFLMVSGATYMATPMYTSEARITIPPGQESTVPATALTQTLSVYMTRAEQIQTQIEILQSRNLVEKTIDELPDALFENEGGAERTGVVATLRKTVGGVVRAARGAVRSVMQKARITPKLSERESFILSCSARLSVKRMRETDVIGLSFKDRSPQVAQLFLNKFLEIYVREKSSSESSGAVPFFAEQEQKLRNDLVVARKALADFRQEWGILDLASQRESLLLEDGRILSEINQAQAELVQIEASLAAFQSALGNEAPESVLPPIVRESPGVAEILRNLATLRAREGRLWTELGENHPDILNIRNEIGRMRLDLRTEGRNMLDARALTLTSLLGELKVQRESIHNRILTLEAKAREMVTLEMDAAVLEKALEQYAGRRETSRMSAAMEAQQINAINIIEPPNLAYKPSSPIVPLNLALGMMFGVFLGLCYVMFRHRFSTTIYIPEDLHEALAPASRGDETDEKPATGHGPYISQLPDMAHPRAQGFLRRLLPSPYVTNAFTNPEAVVRAMPENAMAMMGRKFFFRNNERHIPKSLLLSGTGGKVGVTTCAKLLAEHLCKSYTCRVLLVETNFGRPENRNSVSDGRDFSSWLKSAPSPKPEPEDVDAEVEAGMEVELRAKGCVDVLPAGVLDDMAQSAIFTMTREKLDQMRDGYDVMIFDAEPVSRSSIAQHLAAIVEDVILVARSEATRREVIRFTRDTLTETGGRLTGAICNFRRFYIPNWVYRLLQ